MQSIIMFKKSIKTCQPKLLPTREVVYKEIEPMIPYYAPFSRPRMPRNTSFDGAYIASLK